MPSPRSVLSSAKLIALCTLLSRVTGMLRDMLLAQSFGLQWVQDAFKYGFLIPNLFRRLFGEGALAAVFVPIFTQQLEADGREEAWRLLARVFGLLTLVLSAIIVLLESIIAVIWFSGADLDSLMLGLTAIMLPFMLTVCVLALFSSILNCLGSFVPAALASVVLNVVMIAGILLFAPAKGDATEAAKVHHAHGVAWSVLTAGVLQIAFIVPSLRRLGVPIGWEIAPRDPLVQRIVRLMGPVLLGQGAVMLGTFLDAQLCIALTAAPRAGTTEIVREANWFGLHFQKPLEQGAFSAIDNAQRLYQFPLGVLVISLGTAALPAFSRMAGRGEWKAWTDEIRALLRLAIFEGLLAGAMMIVLAEPIVRLLFEYRRFDAAATGRTSHVLAIYGVCMWAFCAQHIVQRAYYSIGQVNTPLRIALVFLPLNFALSAVLVWFVEIRESAFAISSAITSSMSVLVGIWILRKRAAGGLLDRRLFLPLAKMLAAAVASALIVYFVRNRLLGEQWLASIPRVPARMIDALGFLALGTLIYLAAAWALGVREVRQLVSFRRPA